MSGNDDSHAINRPKSVVEIIAYLKAKIKSSRDKAASQFARFAHEAQLHAATNLRGMLNRIRDELRSLNPQPALAAVQEPVSPHRLPFTARISPRPHDL